MVDRDAFDASNVQRNRQGIPDIDLAMVGAKLQAIM